MMAVSDERILLKVVAGGVPEERDDLITPIAEEGRRSGGRAFP